MREEATLTALHAVEICAGAGGQSLGLHLAGFEHDVAIELDSTAAQTLAHNFARLRDTSSDAMLGSIVRVGDVADDAVWEPKRYDGVDLVAGGVPCPPFSLAGRQLGAQDERDLFAWAIELAGRIRPRALLLENVRGLAGNRFAGYRQAVADRLQELGYWSQWQLLHASSFDVPQLRPRFVLVALAPEYVPYFRWPLGTTTDRTVGNVLVDLMAARGWKHAATWAHRANGIGPTIVGGSKRHGGADLGPTRAKQAWRALAVDGHGIADAAPDGRHGPRFVPRLTCEMVARLQGWYGADYAWTFLGRKTSQYRQIGNAFPPPMARAVASAIADALRKAELHQPGRSRHGSSSPANVVSDVLLLTRTVEHDHVYRVLRDADSYMTVPDLVTDVASEAGIDVSEVRRRLELLRRDFVIDEIVLYGSETAFRLVEFKAFRGEHDHARQASFAARRTLIS